jgi:hypothetical protein
VGIKKKVEHFLNRSFVKIVQNKYKKLTDDVIKDLGRVSELFAHKNVLVLKDRDLGKIFTKMSRIFKSFNFFQTLKAWDKSMEKGPLRKR